MNFRLHHPAFLSSIVLLTGCIPAYFPQVERSSTWAPDEHIVYFFDTFDTDKQGIYAIRLDGSDRKPVVERDVIDYSLSPDGKQIAYRAREMKRSPRGIVDGWLVKDGVRGYVKQLSSGDEVLIGMNCSGLEWHPDGKRLAVLEDRRHLFIWDTANQAKKKIFPDEDVPTLNNRSRVGSILAWSRDGSILYFYFDLDLLVFTPDGNMIGRIEGYKDRDSFVADLTMDEWHRNQESGNYGRMNSHSPNGNYRAIEREGSLWLVSKNGEERELIKNWGSYGPDAGIYGFMHPEWTPDSEYIVGGIKGHLVVVEVSSGRVGRITRGNRPLIYKENYHPGYSWTVH